VGSYSAGRGRHCHVGGTLLVRRYVNIGVETQAEFVQQAAADNRDKMSKLLEALKMLGITDKDIQTTNCGRF
jgi:ABC-type Mn2+/Zn2+ transport system ATPase subunit